MEKILVVGAAGQLGGKLVDLSLKEGYRVYGTFSSRKPDEKKIDQSFKLSKQYQDQVEDVVSSKVKPDIVVDTAALHNVDYCEFHEDEAMLVNAKGTGMLARAAKKISSKYVFVSTDFVFDGEAGREYTEEDKPNPLSVYAKSKLEGERLALSEGGLVVRPAVIFSYVRPSAETSSSSGKPLNFGAWLYSQISSGKNVNIVGDQITSPTLADDLALAILALVRKDREGVYHTAGATPLSRYDFSVRLAEKMKIGKELVHEISSSDLKQAARRPRNSSLSSKKLERDTGHRMMDIEQSLEIFAQDAKKGSI